MLRRYKTLNDDVWRGIERRSESDRRDLLKWQLQAREPIKKFSDIEIGDHLVKKASIMGKDLYYHPFLCTGRDREGNPIITHYYNTPGNAIRQIFTTLSFGSGSATGQVASVQEYTLPHEDFIKSERELQEKGAEVERVVWPKELKRFPVHEVINRAKKRKDEGDYHLAENNCESFVMWCLCGHNVSLQATSFVGAVTEFLSGIIRTCYQGLQQIPKLVTESVEIRLGRTAFGNTIQGTKNLSGLGSILGAGFSALVEIVIAVKSIYEARQKWKDGVLITSRAGFIREVIDAVMLALTRSGFSIGGMFIGSLIPIPFVGSFIGLLIGTLIGHLVGKGASKASSERIASAVDGLIAKEQQMGTTN